MKKLSLCLIVLLIISCNLFISGGSIQLVNTILVDQFVVSLAFEDDGTTWAGIIRDQYGLVKINPDGSTEIFDHTNSCLVDLANIWDMDVDSDGNLWMLNEGLVRYNGHVFTKWDTINEGQLIVLAYNQSLVIDENDNIWCVATNPYINCPNIKLISFDGNDFTVHEPSQLNSGTIYSVTDIAIDKMNNAWFSFNDYHGDLVFLKYNGSKWTSFDTSDVGYSPYNITDIEFDSENNLWFNDDFSYSSIAKHNQAALFVFDKENKATSISGSEFISSLYIDVNDNLWVSGFLPNLAVYNDGKWTFLDNEEAIPFCSDINVDNNGDIWYATSLGIKVFRYIEED
ncbi:MAG: hypothetical protein WCT23_01865 [Candidatus Neomarinimicrobiota bacterium]